ncbi:helix-turn-helix transcriptional regulator [Actinopolyspora halophila]|uniref:helix-turn-helix transcriptional regulator n=1 Tax=Actinopolyspora halophila TaxID=1850 RepID=UPI00036DB113|nr:LuxR family transcriptional regulator [Actinopolyspora halophila]
MLRLYLSGIVTTGDTVAMSDGNTGRAGRSTRLHGREDTVDELRERSACAAEGNGAVVVLTGPRGSGKTTLLERVARDTGFAAVDLCGVRAERDLTLSGLARLATSDDAGPEAVCSPEHDEIACCTALLRELTTRCRHGPVLLRVDDAGLVDPASLRVLGLLGRRLHRLPLLLVFAVETDPLGREPATEPLEGFDRIALGPLDEWDGARLLRERARCSPAPEAVEDALTRCGGLPLALSEVAESLTAERAAGLAPPRLPPDGRLLGEAENELRGFTPPARRLALLLMVGEPLGVETVHRAAPEDSGAQGAWRELLRAGLVYVSERTVHFSCELVRVGLLDRVCPAESRQAHLRLAEVFERGGDRARAVRHRCAAGEDFGGRLLVELTEAAESASRLRDHSVASELYELAADHCSAGGGRGDRLLAAGSEAWADGDTRRARALSRRAGPLVREVRARATNELLRGGLELCDGDPDAAGRSLTTAAEALLGTDRKAAFRALMLAGEASCVTGDYRGYYALARRVERLRCREETAEVTLMLEHFEGMSATFRGSHAAAVPPLRRVVRLAGSEADPMSVIWGSQAAFTLGLLETSHELARRARDFAHRNGDTAQEPWACVYGCLSALAQDRYAEAESAALEGLRLARGFGQRNRAVDHLVLLALVAALRGDLETVRVRLDRAFAEELSGRGLGRPDAFGSWGAACAELADGRPAEATRQLRLMSSGTGGFNPAVGVLAAPHFVEAAVSCGEFESAERLLTAFDRWVSSTESTARLALSHRCHALLAGRTSEAEERFRTAVELHRGSGSSLELAKTELLYAGRLRRARRPTDARELLGEAHTIFRHYGAERWADRARAELRATGHTVPGDDAAVPELTGQQSRISALVTEGATNREIAERLYISERTVEHHLRNVFVKLGVRSRVELTRMLG